jgi:predicted nucleic acid-binding Zn ribbon protein
MSDPPASVCETCGEGPVEKVLFPVAVHFKGSGFYATDYGRGSRKPSAKEGESGPASSDGAGKSDKPAVDAKTSDTKQSES